MSGENKITKLEFFAVGAVFFLLFSGVLVLFSANFRNDAGTASEIRVACVGDSITEGSGYPAALQAKLGAGYSVGNFGVGGSTVLLNSSKPYTNQTAFQDSKKFQPDIVVIMLGTNDASTTNYEYIENFTTAYRGLVEEFQNLESKPQIWLVEPPPIHSNQLNLSDTNLVQGIIPRIEEVANDLGLPTINVHETLTSYPEYFGDGVHPSNEGAQLIADEINQAITSATARDADTDAGAG